MIKGIYLTLFVLFAPSFAVGQVVINEIAWMGTPVEGVDAKQHWRYEWVVPQ